MRLRLFSSCIFACLTACEKATSVQPPEVQKDTFNVHPSDQPQVLTNSSGLAAVKLVGNTVEVNTRLVLTVLDPTVSPLNTKLDKYPAYVLITSSTPLTKPAVVAVCPPGNLPADVRARLRLGHQPSGGFEITPAADGSFLDCSGLASAQRRMPAWIRSLASLVLPKPLYARMRAGGGVGGSASEFSPFGPVDPELRSAGGVGGSATEFQQGNGAASSGAPGAGSTAVANGVCTSVDAPAGASLEKECRPGISLKTAKGTILTSVPISWAVTTGGGSAASEVSGARTCGTFASNASSVTNENGKAGACWTLGANAGANTVVATPSAGGDAPQGVTFSPPSMTFAATGLKITPVATATGGEFTFDGLPHAGSASCSNGLVPTVAYSPGGTTPPRDVGSYAMLVTCGAGNPNFNAATATASIAINATPATIAILCPASVTYTGNPLTPCAATVTGQGLNQTVTPQYSGNVNAGTATASVNFPGAGTVGAASASRTFQILPAASAMKLTCTAIVYDSSTQFPCDAVASGPNGVTQPVTVAYSPTLPRLAGTYTATATFVSSGNLQSSSATTTFTVAKAPASAVAGSGGMLPGGTVPPLPCVVIGLFASDAGAVTCSTSVPPGLSNGANTTTAVVTPSAPANYSITPVQGTLTVGYVQVGCFGAPLQPPIPPTSSGIVKGTNILVTCRLLGPGGVPVLNARSNTVLFDKGVDGTGQPTVVQIFEDIYNVAANGAYSFVLSTSSLTAGRYYGVYAYWNDGSESAGWFYLKP